VGCVRQYGGLYYDVWWALLESMVGCVKKYGGLC